MRIAPFTLWITQENIHLLQFCIVIYNIKYADHPVYTMDHPGSPRITPGDPRKLCGSPRFYWEFTFKLESGRSNLIKF